MGTRAHGKALPGGAGGGRSMVARAKDKAERMRSARQSPYAKVLRYLYLGMDPGARAGAPLPPGTTHVLNLTNAKTYAVPANVRMLHFPIADDGHAAPALMRAAPRLCAFIESARVDGGVCFCHCRAGISRSATVVLYYLMSVDAIKGSRVTAMSLAAGLAHLKSVRPMVSPNPGFMAALCQAETKLRGGEPSIDVACYRQHCLGK
jgi:predicted protein tyrosine phosphatase